EHETGRRQLTYTRRAMFPKRQPQPQPQQQQLLRILCVLGFFILGLTGVRCQQDVPNPTPLTPQHHNRRNSLVAGGRT
ncbi:hypothetical protein Pmani_009174, partial [Petrolisthes manimaculis]